MVNETLCNLSLPVVKQIQEGTGDAQLPSQVIGASIWLRRVPWRISRWKMARSRIQARFTRTRTTVPSDVAAMR